MEFERIEPAVGQACESVSHDSPHTASELSALKTWLVRSAKETDFNVTDGGSHVKRVVTRDVWQDALSLALLEEVWQPGSTRVELIVRCVLSVQLPFMMFLTILASLRWSCAHQNRCRSEDVSHDSSSLQWSLSALNPRLARLAKVFLAIIPTLRRSWAH